MSKFRLLLYSANLFLLAISMVAVCIKLAILLINSGPWGIYEYIAVLLILEVILIGVYGILNSFFDKVIQARKLRLSILEFENKVQELSTAEKPGDRPEYGGM